MSTHGPRKEFTDEQLAGTFQHAFETPVGMNCKGTGLKIIEQRDDGYCICGDPPTKERPNPAKLHSVERVPLAGTSASGGQTEGREVNSKSTLDEIADEVHANAVAHGFHPDGQTEREFINEQVCNLHREVSELHDAWRAGNFRELCDKADKGCPLTCAEEEYADIIIRTLDQCRRLKIDIAKAVLVKHEFNKGRPFKHGRLS